jgi:heme A synthase
VLALSGALVVDQGAGYACAGWPLCGNGFQLSSGQLADVNLLHRFLAGAVVIFLGYAVLRIRAARRPGDRALGRATVAVALLVVAQVVAGALVVDLRLPAAVRAIHLALASALWACVIATAVIARGTEATDHSGDASLDRHLRVGAAAS